MANYSNNKKSIGLKGGPNEYITNFSDFYSSEGYKADSPDVNNPYNIINSGNITMEGVDFPVIGTDNLGNRKLMTPGNNYQFPGDQVFEVPMAQAGREVPKRKGVRLNYDKEGNVVGESTHIMRTETDGKGNWFSFPTLFQNEDGTWVDMSISLEEPWEPVYQEALKRGEVIDFGTNKEAAIKFGEGSWKKKLRRGGSLPRAQEGFELNQTSANPFIYGDWAEISRSVNPATGATTIIDERTGNRDVEYSKRGVNWKVGYENWLAAGHKGSLADFKIEAERWKKSQTKNETDVQNRERTEPGNEASITGDFYGSGIGNTKVPTGPNGTTIPNVSIDQYGFDGSGIPANGSYDYTGAQGNTTIQPLIPRPATLIDQPEIPFSSQYPGGSISPRGEVQPDAYVDSTSSYEVNSRIKNNGKEKLKQTFLEDTTVTDKDGYSNMNTKSVNNGNREKLKQEFNIYDKEDNLLAKSVDKTNIFGNLKTKTRVTDEGEAAGYGLKYGGSLPEAQIGKFLKAGVKKLPKYVDDIAKYIDDGAKYVDDYFNPSVSEFTTEGLTAPSIVNKSTFDIGKFNITGDDVMDIAVRTRERLLTDKFIKNNMTATGRTRQEVIESIDNFTNEFNGSTIYFDDLSSKTFGDGSDLTVGAIYNPGKVTVNTNKISGSTREAVLGKIEHEIEHMFSDVGKKGEITYSNGTVDASSLVANNKIKNSHPILQASDEMSAADKQYFNLPHEQQVRFRKAIRWMEDNIGLKVGDDITDDHVEKLSHAMQNWSREVGEDFAGKGGRSDVYSFLTDLDPQQFLKEGQVAMLKRASLRSDGFKEGLKNILNQTYGAIPAAGVGTVLANERDGGEQLPQAQIGAFLKSAVKQTAKQADNFIKYADDGVKWLDNWLAGTTDNVVAQADDELVQVYKADGSTVTMPKTEAIRLNRIEDANATNDVFKNYEDGNWFSNEVSPFYLNNTKNSIGKGYLDPKDSKRMFSMYLDPKDAVNFKVSDGSTARAMNMSGGMGNLPHPNEYLIPPSIVKKMRDGKSGLGYNTMIGDSEEIMSNLESFYKKLGGSIPKAQFAKEIKYPAQNNAQDPVQKPEPTSWSDYINPYNWGVTDRDDDGDFKQAFRAARKAGENEFMYYGKRYTTELDKTVVPKETVLPNNAFTVTPQLLYKQAFVESRLDPKAKNSLGYMGLGQIGDNLITDYKKVNKVDTVDPYDPKQNHDVQEWSMNELYNASFIDKPGATAENRLIKALASYNYGRGNVIKILNAEKAKGNDIYKSNDWTKQLPKETREYIDMILYDGVTEKRPDVQTNFKKATEEDSYKDLRTLYKYQEGGEPLPKAQVGSEFYPFDGGYESGNDPNPYPFPFPYGVPVDPDTDNDADIVEEEVDITQLSPLDISLLQPPIISIQDGTNLNSPILTDHLGRDINDLSPEDLEAFHQELSLNYEQGQIQRQRDQELIDQEYIDPNQIAGFVRNANQRGEDYERGFEDFTKRSPEDVQLMQRDLLEKGYDIGLTGADGIYGRRTHDAYSSMIADAGLEESAISRYDKKYNPETYTEVKAIQTKLIEKGFLPEITDAGKSNIDGKFGERTKMALLDYNTSKAEEEEDVEGLIFDTIPTTLEDDRCAAGMCEILELNDVETEAIGVKYKDAWDLLESMEHVGNSVVQFNIYDDSLFDNVDENTSVSELKNLTAKAKRKHQTTASNYKVGDIVGIYWPGSSHHKETLNSETYNTHSGFVSSIDENGTPIITHNVGGNIRNVPYNELATAWISRPNENIKLTTTYAEQQDPDNNAVSQVDPVLISNFENKIERPLTDEERTIVSNIMQRANYNSKHIPEILNSSIDQEWLNAAIFGITGVETAGGINAPRTRDDLSTTRALAHRWKDTKDADISLGIGKTKYNSLDNFARNYFEINSPADLADDNKAVDAISYMLVKNYELFKNYAQQYPTLGLAEEDVRNMTLLSYNQGVSKLLTTGRNDENTRNSDEELAALRELYEGSMADISSTNYSRVPGGEGLYNAALAIGYETPSEGYISKTNRYITEVYGGSDEYNDMLLATNITNNNTPPVLAKGGEYGVFKNYVNGDYNNTPRDKSSEKVFDKLNRRHYKEAKALGMSPSNYIMSHLVG